MNWEKVADRLDIAAAEFEKVSLKMERKYGKEHSLPNMHGLAMAIFKVFSIAIREGLEK